MVSSSSDGKSAKIARHTAPQGSTISSWSPCLSEICAAAANWSRTSDRRESHSSGFHCLMSFTFTCQDESPGRYCIVKNKSSTIAKHFFSFWVFWNTRWVPIWEERNEFGIQRRGKIHMISKSLCAPIHELLAREHKSAVPSWHLTHSQIQRDSLSRRTQLLIHLNAAR